MCLSPVGSASFYAIFLHLKANEIYLKVGFKNLIHFSFALKKEFGMPPSQVAV